MMNTTIPDLINTLRPTLRIVADWAGVPIWTARIWQQGTYPPKPAKRAALVKAVRKHAARLLALAEQVEREGASQRRGK